MQFRDLIVDDILIVGPWEDKILIKELKEIARKYNIVDIQYSTQTWKQLTGPSALVLVRNKK